MKTLLIGLVQLVGLVLQPAYGAEPEALSVIEAADRIRNPTQPFRVIDTLTEYVDGKPQTRTVLIIHAKRNRDTARFSNLIRYLEPGRDAGKLVLMDSANLWLYDPAPKASIRISPEQRLTGQASDADVLSVDLAKDYDAKILGAENIQDADRQDRDCWHLDLRSAAPEATYNRIEYWVERERNRPVKGKFYADSGRLLKIAYYHRYGSALGSERPTEVILLDAVNPNLATTIAMSDFRYEDIPASWFQRDFLPRVPQE
jgi:hypothetical protein